jgi:acyl-[acyl-carrier-protein]-phospholipid O-acyltransferase/long-chain-fatty-acid--[acyl-carrier-protein] ligase
MKSLFRHPGIGGLLFAQSQVAFNDNATKLALIGLVQILLPKDTAAVIVSVIALLLVSPFVILAPLSGWLADRFPKRHVLSASLWLQLAVMLLLIGAALFQFLPLAVGGFFLLGAQSAFMSPARRGMIKELAGDSVGEVVGWMEMLCIAAILGGSLAGGQLIDGLTPHTGSAWSAAGWSFFVLALGCVLALWSFRKVPAHPPAAKTPFSWRQVLGHWGLMKTLGRDRRIWRAAWGDAAFYFAGGVLMLTLAEAGRALYPEGLGAARETGIMMATMGGGIAVGSLVAARLCRHQILTGVVPVAALGLALGAFVLAVLPAGTLTFYVMLFVLGLCGGLYLVPLGAFLVDRAPEEERGTILAASSMLSSIAGVLAVGAHALAKSMFALEVPGQFVGLGIFFVLTSLFAVGMIPAETLRVLALVATKLRYQVISVGNTNIPKTGGVLVVCNHVSYVDTLLLSMASNRPIRFLSYAGFFSMPVLGWILKIFGAIPVSQTRVKDAILKASDCIRQGEVVCIFPEGQLTRTGCLMEFKSGFELIARRAKCPVIVAHLDGVWGSIYSFEGGRYFTKWPQGLRRRVTVSFSQPLATAEASTSRVREEMVALGETAFRKRES